MFYSKVFALFLLVIKSLSCFTLTLRALNDKLYADYVHTESGGVLVKALENLGAPYATVNTLDLTIQLNAEHKPLKFAIMEHCNSVLKNLQSHYANIINVNQPKPKEAILNVWIVDDYTNFLKIHSYAEENSRNRAGIYLIVLFQTKSTSQVKRKIKHIFRRMFEINVLNVLVMLKVKNQQHILYAYKPFTDEHCRKIRPFIVHQFPNGSLINNGIWPYELKNLHECSLTVYTWDIPPFMIFDNQSHGNYYFTGIEGKMLRVIAHKLNFTLHLLTDKSMFYGDIDKDGNATGPFFLLQNGFVDILMGSFFNSPTRTQYLSETRTYMSTKLVAIVKKINTSVNYTEWIFDPFTKWAWLFIMVYTIKILGLTLLLIPPTERFSTFFNFFASCLGVGQRLSDTRKRFCFTIMIWTFGFLIIRNAYQAEIYDAYRVARLNPPPETLDMLAAKRYTLYSARIHNDSTSSVEMHVIGLANEILVLEVLGQDNEYHSAGIVNYARLLHYIFTNNKNDLYDIVRQPIFMQQLCAYFQSHSYLTHPFDNLIAKIQSSGLLQKWSKHKFGYDWDMPFSKIKLNTESPKPMTIYKFKWLFIIIVVLHTLAIVVFIIEIWGLDKLIFWRYF